MMNINEYPIVRMAFAMASRVTSTSANIALHIDATPTALNRSIAIFTPRGRIAFCLTVGNVFLAVKWLRLFNQYTSPGQFLKLSISLLFKSG